MKNHRTDEEKLERFENTISEILLALMVAAVTVLLGYFMHDKLTYTLMATNIIIIVPISVRYGRKVEREKWELKEEKRN